MALPGEIWTQIFVLAADEDLLFQPGIPTSMAESAWYRDSWKAQLGCDPSYEWNLRSPEQAVDLLLRRSYATKKAIIATCRQWRQLAAESLFRCLYFNHPAKAVLLLSVLDASSTLSTTATSSHGWWTRRIHIGPDIHPLVGPVPMEIFQTTLISLLRHCPNLEIFIFQRPLGSTFGPVIDALATYASRRLHTVHLSIPGESVSKIIWAFSVLPNIITAHIDIGTDVPLAQEVAHLGSAQDLQIRLPCLQQISLRGYVGTFLEQITEWDLPALRSFSIASGTSVQDQQDVAEFLKHHGVNLMYLDLNVNNFVNVPMVLDLCPNLSTFAFNADWRLIPQNSNVNSIVNRPHQQITTIGLHGLAYAFGVGMRFQRAAKGNSFEAQYAARSNDLNMAALHKYCFPKLQRIRALSQRVLEELNKSNGPSSDNGGYRRWNDWWSSCSTAGIRLEDCTGQLLGTLPGKAEADEDEDEESEDEDEDEDRESDGDEDEDEDDVGSDEEDGEGDRGLSDEAQWRSENPLHVPDVLTQLIQEVRAMNETRDEALIARVRIPRPPSPWGA